MAKRAPSDPVSRQRHRLVIWLGTLTLLLSLMGPLVAIQAANARADLAERLQGVPPNCDEGFQPNAEGTECVPIDANGETESQPPDEQQQDQQQPLQCPEGQIPDETGTECIPDPAQQQPQDLQPQDEPQTQPQPVSLYVQKWECPAGYNAQAEDLAGLGPCGTPASTAFQMTLGTPSGETTTQPVQESWELTNVPAGQYWLSEQVPEGYAQPAAWCTIYDPNVGPTARQLYAFQSDGRIYVDIPPGMALYCNWYNVAIQQDNTVTVYKWECDPGTEYGQSPEYYQGGLPDQETGPCETEHLNLPISLIDATGPRDTSTQANGTQWDNVALDQNGSFQVAVDEPDGYGDPMVFCGPLDQDTQSAVPATGGTIALIPATTPFDYQCNWYNIPIPYGQVVVEKYWCPPGLAFVQTPTQADMQAACQDTGSGATFELNGPEDNPQMWEAKSPEGGPPSSVVWDQLPAGLYAISETGLDDAWTHTVYCHESAGETNGAEPQMQALVDGNAIEWQLQPGYTLSCAWFNQPAGDNTVTVYKWECAEGTEYGRELEYYQGGLPDQEAGPCETEHLNVPISLIDANGQRGTTTQANGTQWDNVVLNNGSFQIAIDEPDGYGDPMVFCGTLDQDTQTAVPASGGTFTLTPATQPFDYQCNAYDIPAEGNTVTVYKWRCEPGTESGQSLAYYQGEGQDTGPCETEDSGMGFTLADADGPDRKQATHNTTWTDVTPQSGSFQLSEEIPPGYGDPMVFCGTLDQDSQSPQTATGGTVTLSPTAEPFDYQCNWYNIPADGGYQLEVHKYLCAYDVDPTLGLPDLGTTCPQQQGVSFTATFGTTPTSARYTDATGQIIWADAPAGDWALQETVLPGWGTPKVYCGPPATTEAPEVPVVDLAVSGTLDSTNPHIICSWFNFELEQQNGRITLYKYQCPPGTTSTDFLILQESCTIPFNGVNFDLQMDGTTVSASTVAGTIDWLDLEQGAYTVREHLLPGYEQPLAWCGYIMQDGANIDPASQEFTSYPVTDASIRLELNNFPARIACYWYNLPVGPGEITMYKWLCPPGYDLAVWGADPKADCTTPLNGVTFTLDRPEGIDLITNTGDSINGAVYFGGLAPGTYTVTETIPPDTASVFVLDCTGTNIPKVHQYPLSWGNKLEVNLAAADEIVCNWYNVGTPKNGWLTVYKYQCWTPTFTSTVNCEIYEFGASFELLGVPGGTSYGSGTTNAMGVYTWNDLPAGSYTLDEVSQTPCKITSTKVDGSGNAQVDVGEGTAIRVYNCKSPQVVVTPSPPGKVPGKYPNTGVEPNAAQEFMPAAAPALQGDAESTPQDGTPADEYYRISCLEEPLEPIATPTAIDETAVGATETPEEFDLAIETEVSAEATAGAKPGAEAACPRGALPERVQIDAVSVDAGVETLEIIDGVMQQPTGPNIVAWYKETGRLGEPNNVVMAGHLNWWNVPEGVFFRLQDLQEGDRVEVTGDDGRVYVYEVQWVRQESNLEPPAPDVIGPTDEATLTLITCGGEWNADIAEYDARTVVRAVQVDVLEPEASASAAAASRQLAA